MQARLREVPEASVTTDQTLFVRISTVPKTILEASSCTNKRRSTTWTWSCGARTQRRRHQPTERFMNSWHASQNALRAWHSEELTNFDPIVNAIQDVQDTAIVSESDAPLSSADPPSDDSSWSADESAARAPNAPGQSPATASSSTVPQAVEISHGNLANARVCPHDQVLSPRRGRRQVSCQVKVPPGAYHAWRETCARGVCGPTEEHTTNHVRTLSEHSSVKSRKNARSITSEKPTKTTWGHTAHKDSRKNRDLGRETRWRSTSSRVEARSGPSAGSRTNFSGDLLHVGVSAGECIDTIERAGVQIRCCGVQNVNSGLLGPKKNVNLWHHQKKCELWTFRKTPPSYQHFNPKQ